MLFSSTRTGDYPHQRWTDCPLAAARGLRQYLAMTATEARTRYMRLQVERIDALELGVDEMSAYIVNLSAAIADAKTDYVASAVAEIADIRVDLDEMADSALSFAGN